MSPIFINITFFIVLTSFLTLPAVNGVDIINLTATDIQRNTATLVWEWSYDNGDGEVIGCEIVTSLVDTNRRQQDAVEKAEIEGVIENYTLYNLTAWTRYQSCITPWVNNSNATKEQCTDSFVTLYDPWTIKAMFSVVCAGWLLFCLLIAVAINAIWPRSSGRTFSMDKFDDDEEDEVGQSSTDKGIDNDAFFIDEDAGSVVDDWNAAAVAALKGPEKKPEKKEWSRGSTPHHGVTRMTLDEIDVGYDVVDLDETVIEQPGSSQRDDVDPTQSQLDQHNYSRQIYDDGRPHDMVDDMDIVDDELARHEYSSKIYNDGSPRDIVDRHDYSKQIYDDGIHRDIDDDRDFVESELARHDYSRQIYNDGGDYSL